MGAAPAVSECRHCKQEIRADATKCPHCRGSQSRWMPDPQNPLGMLLMVGMILLLVVPFTAFTRVTLDWLFHDPEPGLEQLVISESEMRYSSSASGNSISVVGKLRNAGNTSLENPHFEVRFFNADGKLIDSLASAPYDLIIPAKSEVSFRARGAADRPAREYAKHEIRLTGVSRVRLF